jgi:transcriptional regulator with XRE-family HTH domain
MTTAPTLIDPKTLGFWVRCIREAQHMSQDALAEGANIDVRTIQRLEAGQAVNLTSRRRIARALGYDRPDVFDEPDFAAQVHKLLSHAKSIRQEAHDNQHPEHMRVPVERVISGTALVSFAETSNAVSLHADDDLPTATKRTAATLFDYIRDLVDVAADSSFSQKIAYGEDLDALLRDLKKLDVALYSAFRQCRMTNDSWADKTPIPMKIGYFTVLPIDRIITDIFVPKMVRTAF